MSVPSRRDFLRTSGAAASLAATGLFLKTDKAAHAAKKKLRHAVIGVGGQGRGHCRGFASLSDLCEIVAICDVDPNNLAKAEEALPDPASVAKHKDFRELLKDESIDTVSIATPDHWHTPIALHAILAGKQVYVEKPCSHNPHEAKMLMQAAEKYGACVQHGTQSRSGQDLREGIKRVQEGVVGKVRMAKAINHQMRGPIGTAEPEAPPEGVDYDLWIGPAEARPFTRNRWHYNWHWFWDTGTGDIGNDGTHQIDVARWGLGVGLPQTVTAVGGQLFYEDDHETPDTQTVLYDYGDVQLMYEMRLWTDYPLENFENGVVFYGDEGTFDIGADACYLHLKGKQREQVLGGRDFEGNLRNFLEASAEKNPGLLLAPISEGAVSAQLCLMGNIGTRVGRKLVLNETGDGFVGDEEAQALWKRHYREGYELPQI
jgi:predicted dehydrogenase